MTKPKTKPVKLRQTGPALILFGLENGKPRAGTFQEGEVQAATKAAQSLGLTVLKVSGPQAQDLAAKLLAGRVNANGRGFVPYIRGNLYGLLQDLAKAQGVETKDAPKSEPTPAPSAEPAFVKSAAGQRLPKTWDNIQVGDLVLSQDTDPKEGWWEAIVVKTSGEMCALKWRQPQRPQRRAFLKHKYNLALMWPGEDMAAKAPNPKEGDSAFPGSWKTIGLQHLVLGKEEGPMEQWWEATSIEVDGDSFKLLWRDFPTLPAFVRPRSALALLHPKPAGLKTATIAAE